MRQLSLGILWMICLLFPYRTIADSSMSKVQEHRHYLKQNIEAFDNLLYKNKQHQRQLKQRSNLLKTQIDQRSELINLIKAEVKILDAKVAAKELEINLLECKLETHLQRYNTILTNFYRNRFSLKPVYYIFSSQGFWEAYNRWQYIQSFNSLLKSRSDQIIATGNSLAQTKANYLAELEQKEALFEEYDCQKQLMKGELKESKAVVKGLQKSGKQLNSKLKKHKSTRSLLEKYYPAGYTEKPKVASNKANQQKTKAFLAKKRQLIWPVRKVRLAKKHGEHKHPRFSDISYFHTGIDIRTKSSKVIAVYKGEVVDVFPTPGHKYTVLLKHGDYFSLYSNLSTVNVNLGEQIARKQEIGSLIKRKGDKTNKLHFELWKDKESLNPEKWLSR